MTPLPVIAVFDVGRSNKKLLLFNGQYEVVHEQTARFAETADEDGFPCENLESLRTFVHDSLKGMIQRKSFQIKAINIAAYGASFVCIDESGKPVLPLYNYLKPYPQALQQRLYEKYGGPQNFAVATASPVLGSLNSGLQLYRIKEQQPHKFQQIKRALHLPQYLSYLLTGIACSDVTSIGCHTALWDFEKEAYHLWVQAENILPKLAPIYASDTVCNTTFENRSCAVGIGLHDSSAALIPYRMQFSEPFLLLSTGTWCITLNPFNNTPLTAEELAQDCLCYLDYKGRPVKAARLFLGPQYEAGVARICNHFNQSGDLYGAVLFDAGVMTTVIEKRATWGFEKGSFAQCDLQLFENGVEAYHYLMLELVQQQCRSIQLVAQAHVKQIFVDGGFARNSVYMNLLAAHLPQHTVYAASMTQGTALGAALVLHYAWNTASLPERLIDVKPYACAAETVLKTG